MDEKVSENEQTVVDNIPPVEVLETSEEKVQNKFMARSHIRRKLEKQSKKTFFLTGFGLIIIFVLLVLFGQTLLINFSVLLSQVKNGGAQDNSSISQDFLYIASPILDPQQDATNSAKIKISGVESSNIPSQIRLYVNDELVDVEDTKANGTFSFDEVKLKEGANTIKAVAKIQDKTSENSNILTINYLKNVPSLTIDYPQDQDTFSGENSTLSVKGKTDPGDTVRINDYIAITKNDGSYSYGLKMQNGENKIKVVAMDQAGNKTEKEIKVTYSP
jgi:hypothetical protein